ncbi:L-lactate dehydrogenase [Spiroplasma endosymbiont of Glossina fuscipes fuscipes]|uniref:L-lactate dehydrogenase n=1 Tax=Spiroplasma endosymbiont of Glossina fuscipes fuscipes TaxID=2004463 RepID=UPI003C755FCA
MKNRKIVLVGCGAVGTSFLYAAINQGLAQEYVLIDINYEWAEGHALDLDDCNPVLERPFYSVNAGTYQDCADADMVVVTAGRPQKEGETRLEMIADNAKIMQEVALAIKASGFEGISLIASNPVDILTTVYQKVTGFNPHTILGSGTSLDSARLRRLIGKKLNVHPSSVHAYIMGEHGDSAMTAWSCASILGKRISDYVEEGRLTLEDLKECQSDVINMAYKIIEKKKSTFYGIGVVLAHIARIIIRGENQAILIGAYLSGEYGQNGIYTGVPAVVSNYGWERIIKLHINNEEQEQFNKSCQKIHEAVIVAFQAIGIQ